MEELISPLNLLNIVCKNHLLDLSSILQMFSIIIFLLNFFESFLSYSHIPF